MLGPAAGAAAWDLSPAMPAHQAIKPLTQEAVALAGAVAAPGLAVLEAVRMAWTLPAPRVLVGVEAPRVASRCPRTTMTLPIQAAAGLVDEAAGT